MRVESTADIAITIHQQVVVRSTAADIFHVLNKAATEQQTTRYKVSRTSTKLRDETEIIVRHLPTCCFQYTDVSLLCAA